MTAAQSPMICPGCGAILPAGAAEGLCPACLFRRGQESNTMADTVDLAPRWTPPAPADLAAKFPELEILSLLGRGGMGAVYQARQKNLERVVALKILPPEFGHDAAFAARFTGEAQAMARLNHPHIVAIHDFGAREGLYYFIMEFVDGMSLRGLLDSGHVSPKEALAIVPQICEALQFAHDRGIVHRDIKPENILLSKQGQVKIADFGLAKLMGRGAGAGGETTEKVMGTPQYMAPEQMERPGEVDHRADIYSLGVVFYQMLTGELPAGKFGPPSRKVLIDVRLDEVVLRALEREPEKRYQQVSEVKTEVETILRVPAGVAGSPAVAEGSADAGAAPPVLPPSGLPGRFADRPHAEIRSHFSRTAIIGAAWTPWVFVFFFLAFTASAVVRTPAGTLPPGPSSGQIILAWVLGALGATSPFGTTALGCLAVSRIRHSAGRIYGLPLALFDALFFPLLALDALIIWASSGISLWIADWLGRPAHPWPSHPAPLLWAVLAMVGCIVADALIIRWAWRAASEPLGGSDGGAAGTGAVPRRSQARPAIIVAVLLAMTVLLALVAGLFFHS
jgi:hypothetical protein